MEEKNVSFFMIEAKNSYSDPDFLGINVFLSSVHECGHALVNPVSVPQWLGMGRVAGAAWSHGPAPCPSPCTPLPPPLMPSLDE